MPQYSITLEDITRTRRGFTVSNRRTEAIEAIDLEAAWTLACFKYYDHNPEPFTQIVDIISTAANAAPPAANAAPTEGE